MPYGEGRLSRTNRTWMPWASGGERLMREQIQSRLELLRKESETGQTELDKAEKQVAYLREIVLRIRGAGVGGSARRGAVRGATRRYRDGLFKRRNGFTELSQRLHESG